MDKNFIFNYGKSVLKRKQRFVIKGRQLGLRTISKRFKSFWDNRKPYWKGTDIELVDDIFNDPDFLDGLPFLRCKRREKEEN